ncbi:hypothetical protein HY478_02895 [Candidatus Uhrbacteria bacterium]|nr:hypothetical protein [Candidatus Uhrbacteria bacterium]
MKHLAICMLLGCISSPQAAPESVRIKLAAAVVRTPREIVISHDATPGWVFVCADETECMGTGTLNPFEFPAFYVVHVWQHAWLEDSRGVRRAELRVSSPRRIVVTATSTGAGEPRVTYGTRIAYDAPPTDAQDGANTYLLVLTHPEEMRTVRIEIFYVHNVPRL